jgi:hypothetical protein
VAFQRASAVGIGILLVFVVDSLFWPARSEPRLREILAERACQMGEVLQGAVGGETEPESSTSASAALAPGAMAGQLALIGELQAEIGVSRSRADGLMRITFLLEALASCTRALTAPIEAQDEAEPNDPTLATARSELASRLAISLDEVAEALIESRAPKTYSADLDRALLNLEGEWTSRAKRGRAGRTLEPRHRAGDRMFSGRRSRSVPDWPSSRRSWLRSRWAGPSIRWSPHSRS